jgi:hypothetical protein
MKAGPDDEKSEARFFFGCRGDLATTTPIFDPRREIPTRAVGGNSHLAIRMLDLP